MVASIRNIIEKLPTIQTHIFEAVILFRNVALKATQTRVILHIFCLKHFNEKSTLTKMQFFRNV